MFQFFSDMAVNPFLLPGLLAGLLASVACGLVGPYVVARRSVFLAGAIAHTAVGGVGAAIYLAATFPAACGWITPLHGALVVAVAAAVVIGVLEHYARQQVDTVIGALWAVGMAVGVLLAKFTPGYRAHLMNYLFGNIALVGWNYVLLLGVLDLLILAVVLTLHKRFLALCLDEEQLSLQGISVLATHLVLLCLVALTVICLAQIVGLILVLALLTLPAATAQQFVGRLGPMMVACTLLSMLLTTLPRVAVYGTRISAEAAIVLSAALVYALSLSVARLWKRATVA